MSDRLDRLKAEVEEIRRSSRDALADLDSLEAAEAVRIRFLGKNGQITRLVDRLTEFNGAERAEAGRLINTLKHDVNQELDARREALVYRERDLRLSQETVDVTRSGRPWEVGHLHLITQTLREIYAIFSKLGFQVVETPEVETDEYNFQLLNFPPDHPAREMQASFYTTNPAVLLRTHTSPGQIRTMRQHAPEPIRVILPGKCYRYEQVTARSEMMFYQVEGLAVGKHITMADLKGVLIEFARQMFGEKRQVRFRCSYFPFTEPSAEVDMDCIICGGTGCRVCKYAGWVEILGAGMVHPKVLENGGYDPDEYSGFAFGMGPDRIAMLKYNINDIRLFYGNDLRFLGQF
ncbi:MAG: phenylalanine--tRNA ligase subunit alpha [Candidatus Bipolaricaulia bacterium]